MIVYCFGTTESRYTNLYCTERGWNWQEKLCLDYSLHRNLLLPVSYKHDREKPKTTTVKATDRFSPIHKKQEEPGGEESESEYSDNDYDPGYYKVINTEDRPVVEEPHGPGDDEKQQNSNSEAVNCTTRGHWDAHTATEAQKNDTVADESAQQNYEREGQQKVIPEAENSLTESFAESNEIEELPVRRSTRERRPPAW